MTLRVNASTAEADASASWAPAGTANIILQVSSTVADPVDLIIELQGQLNVAAPWATIGAWKPSSEPFLVAEHFPTVRVVWHGNKGTLNVWDAE